MPKQTIKRFSPAPWKVTYRGHDGYREMCLEADGEVICRLAKRARRRFDARLMAAAPDLFNALQALTSEAVFHGNKQDQFAVRQAVAALAKAGA